MAAPSVGIPEGVRLRAERPEAFVGAVRRVSVGLGAVVLLWGLAVALLPAGLGRQLLGASWDDARPVLVPVTVYWAAIGVGVAPIAGLRVLAAARQSFRVRLVVAPATILGGVGGALVGGAMGAATGNAVMMVLAAALWWRVFSVAARSAQGVSRGVSARSSPAAG